MVPMARGHVLTNLVISILIKNECRVGDARVSNFRWGGLMRLNRFMLAIVLAAALTGCAPSQSPASPGAVSHTPSEIQYAEYYRRWQASQPPSPYTDEGQRQMNIARLQEVQREAQSPEAIAARDAAARKQAANEARMREREDNARSEAVRSQPKCSVVRVSGLAGGMGPDFDHLRWAPGQADMVARNPLRCRPGNGFYSCRGGAYLHGQIGHVMTWNDTVFEIVTPLDLIGERVDAAVTVLRVNAVCLNNTPPSLDFVENLHDFLRSRNGFR